MTVRVKDTAADGDCAYGVITLVVNEGDDPWARFNNCNGNGVTLQWQPFRLAGPSLGSGIPSIKIKACRNRNNLPDPCAESHYVLPQMSSHTVSNRPNLIALMENIQSVSLARFLQVKSDAPAPYDWSDNGCSFPSWFPNRDTWNTRFLSACKRHDWGYRNFGKKFFQPTDARRAQVDAVFLRDMRAICDAHDWTGCDTTANTAWSGVRLGGGRSFYKP